MDIEAMKQRILERLAALGLNPNAASEAAGLDRDFVRTILRGKSREPSAERTLKLAKALHCRLEWLVTGEGPVTDEAPSLPPRDAAMLELFRGLSPEQQEAFYKATAALAQPGRSRSDDLDERAG
mgnify:CR=1 FL=1